MILLASLLAGCEPAQPPLEVATTPAFVEVEVLSSAAVDAVPPAMWGARTVSSSSSSASG